jgi:hypothetical protein
VEVLVAGGILLVLMTVIYELLWQGRMVGKRISEESSAGQEARLKIKRMTNEIQEGTRLFFPDGGRTSDGVGFVNARGETIFYYVDRKGGVADLIRVNANAPRDPPERLVRNVRHFRATSAIRGRGRAQSRVNIDLAIGGEVDALEVNVVTSIFLRSLELYVPDDPTHESWGVTREGGAP